MFTSTKIFILLACSFAVGMALPANDVELQQVGGVKKYDIGKAREYLNELLEKLEGGDVNFTIENINSATIQVVAGTKIEINADLKKDGVVNNCIITVLTQSWEPKTKVTFKCAGENELVKNL